jgi:glycine/D-amino acid oxidase-like deaminating enzyme
MTVSVWQANGQQPTRTVDMLIVGAGIVGTAAAVFARRHGRTPVITEMRDVALGASGRNAGFMITGLDSYYHHAIARYGHATTREIYALSQRTHAFWHSIIAAHGVRFEGIGSMLLAESEAEADDLRAAYDAMRADGLSPVFHATDPLQRGYLAAIEQPQDGAVHPVQLAHALLRESGAELIDNNELYGLEADPAGGVIVRTRKYTFHAQHVLLCTNAYSMYVHPFFVGKVIPNRAQVLATAPLPAPVLRTCGYSDYGYMYYRMDFDGRLLIGGGRKQNKPAEHDTSDDRTTPAVQAVLDDYLRARFPDVSAPVERRWAGIMGFTPDGLPLVGTLPDLPAVGFAVGFNGHGLAMGAATVELAVNHLLTGAPVGAIDGHRDLSRWAFAH